MSTHQQPQSVALDEWIYSTDGRLRACFTDIGEGRCGEYDPDDPHDEPLLRFDVQIRDGGSVSCSDPASEGTFVPGHEDHGWFWLTDGSYCTQVNGDIVTGEQMARLLLVIVEAAADEPYSRGRLEQLSWVTASSADDAAASH